MLSAYIGLTQGALAPLGPLRLSGEVHTRLESPAPRDKSHDKVSGVRATGKEMIVLSQVIYIHAS